MFAAPASQEEKDIKAKTLMAGAIAAGLGGMAVTHEEIPDMPPHEVVHAEAGAQASAIPGVTIENGANFSDPVTVHVELPQDQSATVEAEAEQDPKMHIDLDEKTVHVDTIES